MTANAPAHDAAAIAEIASSLSELEVLLLIANDLCAKGLMTRVSDINIQTNDLGNRVLAHISQAKGE